MNVTVTILGLALTWAAITGSFNLLNLLLGAVVAAIALFFLRAQLGSPLIVRRVRRLFGLSLLLLYEIGLSATKVAALVMSPNIMAHVRPAIIAFPLKVRTDAEITLLANLITLTPGTLSVDVSADRNFLYVHVLSLDHREALIASIERGFEKKVIEVFE